MGGTVFWRAVAIGLILSAAPGCAPTKIKTAMSPAVGGRHVGSVVVVPFDRIVTPQVVETPDMDFSVPGGAKASDIQVLVPRPSSGHFDRPTMTVPPSVPDRITEMVYQKLHARKGLRILSPSEGAAALKSIEAAGQDLSFEQKAREVARKTGSDAALIGRVSTYRERDGNRWGGTPAAVGFEIKLIGADGETLWKGGYYEKQRPLVEDFVGFWQHGGGFVTADQLAQYGAKSLVAKFPYGQR